MSERTGILPYFKQRIPIAGLILSNHSEEPISDSSFVAISHTPLGDPLFILPSKINPILARWHLFTQRKRPIFNVTQSDFLKSFFKI